MQGGEERGCLRADAKLSSVPWGLPLEKGKTIHVLCLAKAKIFTLATLTTAGTWAASAEWSIVI